MTDHADRLRRDVQAARDALVDGTPERYPNARASVRILDAEALLAEQQQAQKAHEQTKMLLRGALNDCDEFEAKARQAIDALREIERSMPLGNKHLARVHGIASAALMKLGEKWKSASLPIPDEELDRWADETGQDQSTYPLDPEEYWQGIFNDLMIEGYSKLEDKLTQDILFMLCSRKGFDNWWYDLDIEIRIEIEEAIAKIIAPLTVGRYLGGGR